MTATLEDYLPHIGRVTIASAALEEVAIRWGAFLGPDDVKETHTKLMLLGLDKNLDYLREQVTTRVSANGQKPAIKLIEEARDLKNRRSEAVHGVWARFVDVDSGEPTDVGRSSYDKNKLTGKLEWDLSTPTVLEVAQLGKL